MITTVVLDWAGTTVDFGCMAPVDAFNQAFKKEGLDVLKEEIRQPMGMKKRDHILTMLAMPRIKKQWLALYQQEPTTRDIERIYATFEEVIMQTLANYSDVKSGTTLVVDELRQMGLKIGSTTGYTSEMMKVVKAVAEHQGYSPDIIMTPDKVQGFGRPYPYMLFKIMEHFSIQTIEEVIKVGDTISDIEEGKNAGIYTIGLLEGSSLVGVSLQEQQELSKEERLELYAKARQIYLEAGADLVIETLAELPEVIRGMN